MSYKVLLHPKAVQFLNKCDAHLRVRIKNRLKTLSSKPETKGEWLRHSLFWRLRIGDYRAIYTIDKEQRKVIILFIGHRSHVYDDFTKLI